MNHIEVVRRFSKRIINPKKNDVAWCGHNVYCHKNCIFSYGSHFPIAKYLGKRGKQNLFLLNSDKYSDSTSCHQNMTRAVCKGPEVSQNELNKFGIEFFEIESTDILFFRPYSCNWCVKDLEKSNFYTEYNWEEGMLSGDWEPPKCGVFRGKQKYFVGNPRYKEGFLIITNVFVFTKYNKFYLASHNTSPFVVELPGSPKSLDGAIKMSSVKPRFYFR